MSKKYDTDTDIVKCLNLEQVNPIVHKLKDSNKDPACIAKLGAILDMHIKKMEDVIMTKNTNNKKI